MNSQPYEPALCERIGLTSHEFTGGEIGWRIPGTGWRISDGRGPSGDAYLWYYSHDDDDRDYGTVESLDAALRCILAANHRGEGDYPTLKLNRWLPNSAIRAAIRRLEKIGA